MPGHWVAGTSNAIMIGGDWSNTGAFIAGTSTVTLTGGDQAISGNNTFYNLTKSVSTAAILTFQAGTTTTIQNTMTLNGASDNLLSLRSSTPGTQWEIDPQSTRTIDYLDIQDSKKYQYRRQLVRCEFGRGWRGR